ncbi:hypothetical protein HPP92_009774 [Vanilla planifolia]|uniref:Uncharacterized protein n=1 Tax=Vanilla planifolia TaxID=51239 RepID=A0A835V6M7_VANPL|nr:hypothetical protein HPP92_009774 [Vanilla planifolia]
MRPKSTKPEEGKLRGSWLEVLCFGFFCLQLWRKVVFQKWLSICSKGNEFSADEGDTTESESEYEGSHLDGISYNFQKNKEIVELNAGNVFGAEDNRPVSRWKGM